jgi:hypothetical protein
VESLRAHVGPSCAIALTQAFRPTDVPSWHLAEEVSGGARSVPFPSRRILFPRSAFDFTGVRHIRLCWGMLAVPWALR